MEKILRSFPTIKTIYILVRPKKELTIDQRVDNLLNSQLFKFCHHSESQLRKIKPIEGNVSNFDMGISKSDREVLQEEVSIVFHAAASIRFDSQLSEHLKTNVLGTKYLLNLCKSMKNLDCFVFCSTAFSNCHLKDVDEQLYPLQYDVNDVLKLAE